MCAHACVTGKNKLKYLPFENGALHHEHLFCTTFIFLVTEKSWVMLPFKLAVVNRGCYYYPFAGGIACKAKFD